jgi:hypothetical protein
MSQTTSMGVGPATLTLPSGSAKVLGTVRRETITDPNFYAQFFTLVQSFVDQERVAQASAPAVAHPAPLPSAAPTAQASTAASGSRNDAQPTN